MVPCGLRVLTADTGVSVTQQGDPCESTSWDVEEYGDLEARGKWLESTGVRNGHQQNTFKGQTEPDSHQWMCSQGWDQASRPETHTDGTLARTVGWCVGLRSTPSSTGLTSPCCHLGEKQIGARGGKHRGRAFVTGRLVAQRNTSHWNVLTGKGSCSASHALLPRTGDVQEEYRM